MLSLRKQELSELNQKRFFLKDAALTRHRRMKKIEELQLNSEVISKYSLTTSLFICFLMILRNKRKKERKVGKEKHFFVYFGWKVKKPLKKNQGKPESVL